MSSKSTQIALGGVFSALCLVLMFMTGMIPFATYAIPAVAGAMLIPVVVENGNRTALLVYVSVSVLSVFIVPDREAAMMFIAFFGHYPVVKGKLEQLPLRLLVKFLKLVVFNACIVCGYLAVIYVFGMPDILSDMGDFGRFGALGALALGNVVFIVYDFAMTRYYRLYVNWFKPRFLRR